MAESTPLVRIEGLHKSFGSLDVLKGIDLNVQQGQKISLIGPSGSGKTTLLRCVNYLEEPTKGDIYIDNELIGQRLVGSRKVPMSDKELARMRAEIGMVFQRFNLFRTCRCWKTSSSVRSRCSSAIAPKRWSWPRIC